MLFSYPKFQCSSKFPVHYRLMALCLMSKHIIFICILSICISCSHTVKLEKSRNELSRTVEKYWIALKNKDRNTFQKIEQVNDKGFLSPGDSTNFDIDIKEFTIEKISLDESNIKASVIVSFTYAIPILPDKLKSKESSQWIKKDGNWYIISRTILDR
jgi:hypothetical protein